MSRGPVRTTYLTARCSTGCETWLHPKAIAGHYEPGRCRGRPWIDDLPDVAVIPAEHAPFIQAIVEPELVGAVRRSDTTRVDPDDGRFKEQVPPSPGMTNVRSPIPGVSARRWLRTAIAAGDTWGPERIEQLHDPELFAALEGELIDRTKYTVCPICGTSVSKSSLGNHQRLSSVCWWTRAATEVRIAWRNGWRDPASVPGAPLGWRDLQRVRWRRQVRTIAFPRWIAVLLEPEE